jgi:TetR/AcrR family transcriptional regulator, regulator of autoinduction and epiphytic fitness
MTTSDDGHGDGDDHVDPRITRSRQVVRQAALAELAEVGYGRFTVDSVSARCGVARSTIYRHWPDKLALIADAFETLNVQPGPHPADGSPGESPLDRVHRLLRHLAEVFQGSIFSACMPALIEGAERDSEVRDFLHRYSRQRRGALVAAIAAAIDAGEVGADVDAELASLALSGPIIYRRVMTGEPFDPAQVGSLVALVLGTADESQGAGFAVWRRTSGG